MKKVILIFSVLAFTVVSCKKTETENKEEAKPTADVKQNFSVELDVISQIKDDFSLYYTEDSTINFTSDKAVWTGVKAQPASQKVTLNLSEEIIPSDIRLDFGINKEQEDIVLENFKVSYYGKSFQARGSDFFKYFIPNDSIKTEIDEVKGTVKFLKNSKKFMTPFFYPNQKILDEIKKITN